MTTYGYARVSTPEQKLDLQTDALKKAGCEKIFTDPGVSGATTDRPGWRKALKALKSSDVLIVYSLSRVSRSMAELTVLVKELKDRGVAFKSLTESIDTGTAMGDFMLNILGAVAQMERDVLMERVNAGLAAARARGVRFGRPSTLSDADRECALNLDLTVAEAAKKIGVSKRHVYRLRKPQSSEHHA